MATEIIFETEMNEEVSAKIAFIGRGYSVAFYDTETGESLAEYLYGRIFPTEEAAQGWITHLKNNPDPISIPV